MKKIFLLIISCLGYAILFAQDSAVSNVTINKDLRLDILAKKQAEFNDANGVLSGGKYTKGYRLLLLNTSDRALALKVRAQLLQSFPDEKIYMSFQQPNIKLKFGDFIDKDEADKYKTELEDSKIITGNIYIVPELVENKPTKETTTP